MENIPKKGTRENLMEDRENAFLSRQLVTLNCKLDLPLGVDDLRYAGVAAEATSAFLTEWEFKSLLKLVPGSSTTAVAAARAKAASATVASATAVNGDEASALAAANGFRQRRRIGRGDREAAAEQSGPPCRYDLIDTPELLADLAERLRQSPRIAVDTETTDLDNKVAKLVGLCLSVESRAGYYLPVGHVEGRNLPLEEVRRVLKPILDDPSKRLLFHNAKYDLPILDRHGLMPAEIGRPGKLVDTMVAAYLANPGNASCPWTTWPCVISATR